MARRLPADHDIGIAVLHTDGSLTIANGPRVWDSVITWETVDERLEIRDDLARYRAINACPRTFFYQQGSWYERRNPLRRWWDGACEWVTRRSPR